MFCNLDSGPYISPLIRPINSVFYIILIVYFQRGLHCILWTVMAWVTWANVWWVRHKNVPKWPVMQFCWHSHLLLLRHWKLHSHTIRTRKKQNTLAIHFIRTSVACEGFICSHNSLASSHAGHLPGHILLWDGPSFFNKDVWQVSQRGSVGHSSM